MNNPILFWLALALLVINLLLLVWLLLRKPADSGREALLAGLAAGNDRLERELRREISDSSRSSRKSWQLPLPLFS